MNQKVFVSNGAPHVSDTCHLHTFKMLLWHGVRHSKSLDKVAGGEDGERMIPRWYEYGFKREKFEDRVILNSLPMETFGILNYYLWTPMGSEMTKQISEMETRLSVERKRQTHL